MRLEEEAKRRKRRKGKWNGKETMWQRGDLDENKEKRKKSLNPYICRKEKMK